ncbi:cysteine-rich CWC family protein [Acidovorax delafieldii]|uniref:cysteine-rich CWC family protein n=1 Tax=Acidovorax delafieldii TaxID=47920 RepID=UPI0009D9585F|nr:cysteine-rich CWC family protein [Acidovorax delafieldii]
MPITPSVDTHRCPLCGQANQCATVAGAPPETCWCMTAQVSPAALARVPPALRGATCLCPACAAPQPEKPEPPARDTAPI